MVATVVVGLVSIASDSHADRLWGGRIRSGCGISGVLVSGVVAVVSAFRAVVSSSAKELNGIGAGAVCVPVRVPRPNDKMDKEAKRRKGESSSSNSTLLNLILALLRAHHYAHLAIIFPLPCSTNIYNTSACSIGFRKLTKSSTIRHRTVTCVPRGCRRKLEESERHPTR